MPDHIRFSASILQRLGEELNPHPDQGIVELVKNAYDADARKCTVSLSRASSVGGRLTVSDNGDGLTLEEIRSGWLVLGASSKSTDEPTRLGRRQVGNKGLGRLAALRLGHTARLITRSRKTPNTERVVEINWDAFEHAEVVEDVAIDISKRQPTRKRPGTTIEIENLRHRVGRVDVKRLARALLLLADPFGDEAKGFRPVLKAPEFKDLETLVEQNYFGDAEYHLIAWSDEEGYCSAEVMDWRGNRLYFGAHEDIKRKKPEAPYECPPCRLDLWAYILSQEGFAVRETTVQEVQNWLKEFGGVHVYQRGIRVEPYGNSGNDWLDMNLLRAKNPELRPSTETSIGRVDLTDNGDALEQKTDRGGFIETAGFTEVRTFCQDALEWMAGCRVRERDKKRRTQRKAAPSKTEQAESKVQRAIAELPTTRQRSVKQAFEGVKRAHQKEVSTLLREIQLYRTLSTAGIAASTFAHQSGASPLKIITQSAQTAMRRGKKYTRDFEEHLGPPIERILRSAQALGVLSGVTLSLIRADKRRLSRVNVHSVLSATIKLFGPYLEQSRIETSITLVQGRPYIYGSAAAVESVVTNLLTNSMTWLRRTRGQRKIALSTEIEDGVIRITCEDNGPGIQGIPLKEIWTAGRTTVEEGTGLGLAIVRDTVSDLGGTTTAKKSGALGGAVFRIEIPLLD